ncbi:hypothetical protein ASC77_05105 [Nocardioides sp. Root1257]|uniref:hotdog fold thioesterase n=1 Tax=unclassified Nocardioides TaxID=2615069 RepID=UPI0006F29DC2|nr:MULTISPECIES: hotdog fold thioesterase [unclassified Nocardioides]KQW53648.1 hypothetical protein ASC77_05105 [Nocardioides sp. Root1257]KRC56334.1 hypothetical protein ASE24_05105 [Nocardioides sp. Root224]
MNTITDITTTTTTTGTKATIWRTDPDLDLCNEAAAGCSVGHLGVEFTDAGPDHLTARMPVDSRTRQPFGILHGGSSVFLAETLVSFAATLAAEPGKACVGLEINANHLRPVSSGWVTGTARPIALGRRTHVWEVRIVDDHGRLTCVSRCTIAVIDGV